MTKRFERWEIEKIFKDTGDNFHERQIFNDWVVMLEQNLVRAAMEKAGGVKQQAAAILGMGRTTLLEKMRVWGWPLNSPIVRLPRCEHCGRPANDPHRVGCVHKPERKKRSKKDQLLGHEVSSAISGIPVVDAATGEVEKVLMPNGSEIHFGKEAPADGFKSIGLCLICGAKEGQAHNLTSHGMDFMGGER